MTQQPTLTDGRVTIRPWRDDDVAAAIAGHDEAIAHWFGFPSVRPTAEQHLAAIGRWREGYAAGELASFVIDDGEVAGSVEARLHDPHTAELSWAVYAGHRGHGIGVRAVRMLMDWAMTGRGRGGLGVSRVEAKVEPGNEASLRVATRAGMRREGIRRVVAGTGDRSETTEYVVFARLADDPPVTEPEGFRALLNSFLPRKRGIGQMLIRAAPEESGEDRVLLCQLTYKRDWDLPGGVVEVNESPRLAVSRELKEELALDITAGALLLTDWLPPWSGWDDALCLVFDGGVHDPGILAGIVREAREIRDAEFCTLAQVHERAADFTARRVVAALERARGGGAGYTESGRA